MAATYWSEADRESAPGRICSGYSGALEAMPPDAWLLEALELVPGRGVAVDLGCGVGRNLGLISGVGFATVVGFDLPNMIGLALDRHDLPRGVVLTTVWPFPRPPGDPFDVAVLTLVLQHLSTGQIRSWLAEVAEHCAYAVIGSRAWTDERGPAVMDLVVERFRVLAYWPFEAEHWGAVVVPL